MSVDRGSVLVACPECDGELSIVIEYRESAPYDESGIGEFTTAVEGVTRYGCGCEWTDAGLLFLADEQVEDDVVAADERRYER